MWIFIIIVLIVIILVAVVKNDNKQIQINHLQNGGFRKSYPLVTKCLQEEYEMSFFEDLGNSFSYSKNVMDVNNKRGILYIGLKLDSGRNPIIFSIYTNSVGVKFEGQNVSTLYASEKYIDGAIKDSIAKLKADGILPFSDISNNISNPLVKSVENVTDIDGNVYKTIQIGNQVWMAENLRVSRYRNGDLIQNIQNNQEWANLKTGACCNYDNNPVYDAKYGKLYNWFAVDDERGLAPEGWHISTDAEWTTLTTFLGGETVAGGKLKETSIGNWSSPNTGATNTSGFTALPGGSRDYDGAFSLVGSFGYWWSSTENVTDRAWYRYVDYGRGRVGRSYNLEQGGLSVRCVRDY